MLKNKKLLLLILSAVLLTVGLFFPEGSPVRWIFSLLSAVLAGAETVCGAVQGLFHREWLDERFLMTAASAGAFAIGEAAEGALIFLLYQLGEMLQDRAAEKSRRSVAGLMELRADHARVLRQGTEASVRPENVEVGEVILILPGEKIPLDGLVLEGASSLDTVALTGEVDPREVKAGQTVMSGCVNLQSPLKVRVTAPYSDSTVSRILALTAEAQQEKDKAAAEKMITRFARIYTPAVVFSAAVLFVSGTLFSGNAAEWLRRALTFLVISCPCALVISVPMTYVSAIGRASRIGLVLRGALTVEKMSRLTVLCVDKTGTMTERITRKEDGKELLSERLRQNAKEAVTAFRRLGVRRVIMLSGDRPEKAVPVGNALGVDEVRSSLHPADKAAFVKQLLEDPAEKVGFMGDGINDAPVLAAAYLGVAMGKGGADAAKEAADAVLLRDDPMSLAEGIRLAKKARRIVIENIVFSLLVKLAVLILGAFGAVPLGLAVFSDTGVCVLALLNALR